jgi:hypothetical protein
MRFEIKGWMWFGRVARALVVLAFYSAVVVAAALLLSAVLYIYLQALGLIEK